MRKKKYIPKAGDVCEWYNKEVLIASSYLTDGGNYIAYDAQEFERNSLDIAWYCDIRSLKLIYRP